MWRMRNRVSDICIPRLRSTTERLCIEFGHEVVGNLDFLYFFIDFFTEFKTYHLLILFINLQETNLKSSTSSKGHSEMSLRNGTPLKKHTVVQTRLKVKCSIDYFQRVNHTFN